jgi:hypothetical protein
MADEKTYNIQCFNHGFCGTVRPGDKLYEKCVQREKYGFLDALTVHNDTKNCGECAEEQTKRDRVDLDYYDCRRRKDSFYYEETPLTTEQQADLDSLLKKRGISQKCWNCKDYGGYSVCMDCQRDGTDADEDEAAVRADDSAIELADGDFDDAVDDVAAMIGKGLSES